MFKQLYLDLLKRLLRLTHQEASDSAVIYRLVQLKLTIHERQSPLKVKLGNIAVYLLYSLVVVFFLFQRLHMVQLNIIFALTLFVWFTAMIAEYVPKLFDKRDQIILEGKPIENHLLGAAKFFVVFYDILFLSMSFVLLPVLIALIRQGVLFALVLVFMFICLFLFTTGGALVTYAIIFTAFSGEKLKSAINILQMTFIIAVIVAYQVIIRMYGYIDFSSDYMISAWHFFIPSFWYAAPFQAIFIDGWQAAYIYMSALALLGALALFFLGVKSIPRIEEALSKQASPVPKKPKLSLFEKISLKLFCSSERSKVNFKFIYRITKKSHAFQMKIMPSLGMSLILPFVFLMSLVGSRDWQTIIESDLYILLYFVNLFIGVILFYFQFRPMPQAVWIFDVSSGRSREEMFQATFKVYLLKYYLPVILFVSVIYYFIFLDFGWVDSVLVFLSALIQVMVIYRLSLTASYPFSLSEAEVEKEGSMIRALLLMLLIVPFMSLHYLSAFLFLGKYIYFIILCGGTWLIYQFLFRKNLR